MPDELDYWLGNLRSNFEENKEILLGLDFEKEAKLDNEVKIFLSSHPASPGHGFDHHNKVRTFTTMTGVVNDLGIDDIQTCRYGAMLHDHLKETGRAGKGPHNWPELRKLTKNLMDNAKIESRYLPKVIEVIEQHETDDSSKRNIIGNNLYEADTVDITHLPRSFSFAQEIERKKKGTYDKADKILNDYLAYHITPATPITSVGRKMFNKGKKWSISALQKLKEDLGERDVSKYFNFLNENWKLNQKGAPQVLKGILSLYRENLPNYDINLRKFL